MESGDVDRAPPRAAFGSERVSAPASIISWAGRHRALLVLLVLAVLYVGSSSNI